MGRSKEEIPAIRRVSGLFDLHTDHKSEIAAPAKETAISMIPIFG